MLTRAFPAVRSVGIRAVSASPIAVYSTLSRTPFKSHNHFNASPFLRSSSLAAPFRSPFSFQHKQLHSSDSKHDYSRYLNPDYINEAGKKTLDCVQRASIDQIFHWTSKSLAVGVPVALILSPSFLNFPVDLALGLIVPIHGHIGLVGIVQDYIPRPNQNLAILGLYLVTGISILGLLKINLCGPGLTESLKSLWRKPPPKPKQIEEKGPKH